jgi:murein DD-endopeptidase MepM/ murein hydrolase activator NlpD
MAETLVERAWAWLHATFPERQIYVRSEGRVQFFTFGSSLQATCAGLSLIFLGWVAFASVNVIFKDHIIAAKDHRYRQMQAIYEDRVADLQLSYDQLNNALVSAEDRFKSTADELEVKQDGVARLLTQKQIVDAALTNVRGATGLIANQPAIPQIAHGAHGNMASDSLGADASASLGSAGIAISPDSPSSTYSGTGASQLTVMPQGLEPQPRTARPTKASFLDETILHLEGVLFPRSPQATIHAADPPALRVLAQQTERVRQLSGRETGLIAGLDHAIVGRIGSVHGVLESVGLDAGRIERQASDVGGPFVPLQSVRIDHVSDATFTAAYAGAIAHTAELDSLFAALRHVPLTAPVHGGQFEMTSGFGPRVDPFTRQVAFHTGDDFAGPWGSTVSATAPGTVVWAGARGGYGNMVEIDHGYGFHTRYGHLSAILVRAGAHVEAGSPIGSIGSTGRSTGPHVHYEVWLADKVKDPARYIDTGRHLVE